MNARGIVALTLALLGAPAVMAETPGAPTATVQAGDTLSAIARRHNTTVSELQSLNALSNPDRIHVGQRLRVAASPSAPARPSLRGFRAAYLGGPVAPVVKAAPAQPRAAATPIRMTRFGADAGY